MSLRGAPSARVAIPQGDIYPSGIPVVPPNAGVQSTVRPESWLFHQSAGFHTIRPGKHKFQSGHYGLGHDFTALRYAEDVSAWDNNKGLPAIISQDDAFLHADIAEIPGSQYLTSDGRISSADDVQANRGAMISQGKDTPHHDGSGDIHAPLHTVPDMGDRRADRPLTRQWLNSVLHNPVSWFRDEWQTHPVTAIAVAGLGISIAYMVGRDIDTQIEGRRRGSGPVASSAAAAPATVAAAGDEAKRATDAAADSVKAAGSAVKEATDAAADAVSG
jgi:hypothetical protein